MATIHSHGRAIAVRLDPWPVVWEVPVCRPIDPDFWGRIARVGIELARSGESCSILQWACGARCFDRSSLCMTLSRGWDWLLAWVGCLH